MSHNPYRRNNGRQQQAAAPSSARPIVNPYASRNNNNNNRNRNANNGNLNGNFGRTSALSLMPAGPLHVASPQGIIPPPQQELLNTTANTTHVHSTTHSSNLTNEMNDNNNEYNNIDNYGNVDRIGVSGQDGNGLGNDMHEMTIDVNTSNHHRNTNTNNNNSNNNNSDANRQVLQLQAQLKALQQEVLEQSESNFELNATIATMQAEMDHSISASSEKHKEETSKLQHLLRLEQQKSRRLELQQQQRMQQQQEHSMPVRKRPASQSVFTKRLEAHAGMTAAAAAAAPAIPQSITLPTSNTTTNADDSVLVGSDPPQTPPHKNNSSASALNDPPDFAIAKRADNTTTTTTTTSSPMPTVVTDTTSNTAAESSSRSSASRLAQHILQSLIDNNDDDSSSSSIRRRSRRRHDEAKKSDNDPKANSGNKNNMETSTQQQQQQQQQQQPVENDDNVDGDNNDTEMAHEISPQQEEEGVASRDHSQARRVLIDISSGYGQAWSEVQLVEYILRLDHAWRLWYPALEKSRLGRKQLLQAIVQRHETLQDSSSMTDGQDGDDNVIGKGSRITRLGLPGGNTKALDSSLETNILNSLLDPWWDHTSMASVQANAALRLVQEPKTVVEDLTTIISPLLAYTWIQKLVESIKTKDNQFQALRLLQLILEECSDTHDQTALWEICRQPMEQVLEGLYRQWMFEMAKLIKQEIANNQNDIMTSRLTSKSKKRGDARKRRLEAMPVEELSMESRDIGDVEQSLAHSLSIWNALIPSTTVERLELWFMEQNGARTVSLVLDMLEEHEHLYDKRNRPRRPTYYVIKGWYLDAIQFLSTIGTSKSGMDVLRTRTHPSNVGSDSYWMGNSLDVAIEQLFSLVMDQEQDTRKRSDDGFHARTLAIEKWVRLWHQVLLFVQDQQLPDKQPVALSFRSLVLEHQDWYTSACAVLLADQERTRQDIQAMIRLQLEELSLDEEEYEELRGH
ncbi:unnamed protein product [Cylindrotheca closterium]|uniref:Uncharacterized protein n=1 Tax=Cylindrotheca closterium TaxID=2856 RepID=A0AAD2JIL6_9STRA|nr:unnamed protein product [Cylindrotheca closterium]